MNKPSHADSSTERSPGFQAEEEARTHTPFVPLVLLSAGFVLLLSWQVLSAWNTRSLLRQQFTQQQPQVEMSQKIQQSVQILVNDLMNLATTDPEARQIIEKYNIQRNAN